MRVSEIRVKRIRVNQGLGVIPNPYHFILVNTHNGHMGVHKKVAFLLSFLHANALFKKALVLMYL